MHTFHAVPFFSDRDKNCGACSCNLENLQRHHSIIRLYNLSLSSRSGSADTHAHYSDVSPSSPRSGSRWRSRASATALSCGGQFLQMSCHGISVSDDTSVWLSVTRRNRDRRHVKPNVHPHTFCALLFARTAWAAAGAVFRTYLVGTDVTRLLSVLWPAR